jgi:hypothetical protein
MGCQPFKAADLIMPSIKSSLKIRRAFFYQIKRCVAASRELTQYGNWQQNSIDIFKATSFKPHRGNYPLSFFCTKSKNIAILLPNLPLFSHAKTVTKKQKMTSPLWFTEISRLTITQHANFCWAIIAQ